MHWVRMVAARRMILAAQYMREANRMLGTENKRKAVEEARRLRAQVLLHTDSPRRMRMLFFHNLKF